MADAGLNAVEKAIRAALVANAAINGAVGSGADARIYNQIVPARITTYPVVVFQFMASDAEGRAFSGDAESYTYLVKCITLGDASFAAASDVAEGIDAVMHRATLAPTGYSGGIYQSLRQQWVRYAEDVPDRGTFMHAGAVYRLWAQRS